MTSPLLNSEATIDNGVRYDADGSMTIVAMTPALLDMIAAGRALAPIQQGDFND